MKWQGWITEDAFHNKLFIDVIGIDDIYPHTFGENCKCEPETIYDPDITPAYIHKAFDGQHVLEEAMEFLSEEV